MPDARPQLPPLPLDSQAALRRYEAMAACPRPLPARAWTAIAQRLACAALTVPPAFAQKYADRAEDARAHARRPSITYHTWSGRRMRVTFDDGRLVLAVAP